MAADHFRGHIFVADDDKLSESISSELYHDGSIRSGAANSLQKSDNSANSRPLTPIAKTSHAPVNIGIRMPTPEKALPRLALGIGLRSNPPIMPFTPGSQPGARHAPDVLPSGARRVLTPFGLSMRENRRQLLLATERKDGVASAFLPAPPPGTDVLSPVGEAPASEETSPDAANDMRRNYTIDVNDCVSEPASGSSRSVGAEPPVTVDRLRHRTPIRLDSSLDRRAAATVPAQQRMGDDVRHTSLPTTPSRLPRYMRGTAASSARTQPEPGFVPGRNGWPSSNASRGCRGTTAGALTGVSSAQTERLVSPEEVAGGTPARLRDRSPLRRFTLGADDEHVNGTRSIRTHAAPAVEARQPRSSARAHKPEPPAKPRVKYTYRVAQLFGQTRVERFVQSPHKGVLPAPGSRARSLSASPLARGAARFGPYKSVPAWPLDMPDQSEPVSVGSSVVVAYGDVTSVAAARAQYGITGMEDSVSSPGGR